MVIIIVVLFGIACADNTPSLAIFNQFEPKNPPILFNWQNKTENSMKITNYNNSIGMQIKWSCSAQISDKMYIFGGLPDNGETIKNVLEIVDCGIVDTGIGGFKIFFFLEKI